MQMKVHKDEKKGTFWFVVSAGKNESGKRRQIKRRGFRTEKEAMREMRKILQQVDENTYIQKTNLKYVEFLKGEWLDSKSIKLKENTLATYKMNVKNHIVPYFSNQEIGKITTRDVEKFYAYLFKEKGLSERSILDIHKIVKSSFKTAAKRKYIYFSPVEDAEVPKVPRKEMLVWNLEETTRFLKLSIDSAMHIAFILALTTGMRQSEILGLRWKDINFKEGVLHIRQTLSHNGKKLSKETKTKSSIRSISLTDKALNELTIHKKKIVKEKLRAGEDYEDNDLVICTKRGTPVNPRNLLRVFYVLMKKSKVPKIRFHDLRHTVATLMLTQGINPKIVKEILGHSDIRVTLDTYSHVLPSVHKETAKQYGDMLFSERDII